MEIPYEIKSILCPNNSNDALFNDFIILEPSIFNYFTSSEKSSLISLINDLGELSNLDRHLSSPITSFVSFINSNNSNNKLILKCINDLIIGFIYFGFKPILLRNEYNLNYFYKNLITISDFYIMRNYRRMNYGKELFDKVINMTNIKPVLMAFEFPNKSMMNFLEQTYGISNPIYQANNVITFYNYKDENFNKYLDDYHRVIDVNKMEDDIDGYRKWSPLNNDYIKFFRSDYSYKNIFPLQFNNKFNRINKQPINNRYNNFENNFINNYNYKGNNYNNMNYSNDDRYDKIHNKNHFNRSINNININNNNRERINKYKKQFHLIDKKNIFGKMNNNYNNNNKKNTPIPLAIKDIESNNNSQVDKKFFRKFNDYYLNQDKNKSNNNINLNKHRYARNVKDNYFNYLNNENRYIKSLYERQKEKEEKLNKSLNMLSDRIKENNYNIPARNKNQFDTYYRKNRSFATVFDSIENNKTEENDYREYKKYKLENEYFD